MQEPATLDTLDSTGGRLGALYLRVSTGRQKDTWSIQDQKALARLGAERDCPWWSIPGKA